MSKNNTKNLKNDSAMIVSARNTLARPGSREWRILSTSSLLSWTPCDGCFKTSYHNLYNKWRFEVGLLRKYNSLQSDIFSYSIIISLYFSKVRYIKRLVYKMTSFYWNMLHLEKSSTSVDLNTLNYNCSTRKRKYI